MPLTLLLRSSANLQSAPALTFDGGRVLIGRGPGCDVRLPDPSVSHRHATVRANGSEYTLVDEKSSNGTFVGGARLAPGTPRTLKHKELVRVGRVWLEVRLDQTPATRDPAMATRELALALVSQAMRAMGQPAETCVRVVHGPDAGAALPLEDEGRVYVVGREAASCDLALGDDDVSPAHLNVIRRGGTVLIRDLGSKDGARLGDARIPPDRDVPWRSGVVVRVGATEMILEEPAVTALAELESAADEPMAPGDVPDEPPPPALDEAEPDAQAKADAAPSRAPEATPRGARDEPPTWNTVDLAVVLAALVVLALSLAGLYWLLHA